MRNVLSYIAIIVGVIFVLIICNNWSAQMIHEDDRENNSGVSSKYSRNELYYLGTKEIAKQLEMSPNSLLLEEGFPGINECRFDSATDGGTAVAFPIRENDYTTYIVCEIYDDGSCVISSIEQE